MGSKPSRAMESNRPESGGADHHDQRETSGLLDRDKESFAKSEAAKGERRDRAEETDIAGEESGETD